MTFQVWTTNQAMKKQRHNGGPIINTHPEGGDSNPNRTNGSAASSVAGGGSNTSLNSNPNGGGGPSTATAGQRTMNPNGSMLNGSRASSIVTLQVVCQKKVKKVKKTIIFCNRPPPAATGATTPPF